MNHELHPQLQELCKALGWQEGTYTQVLAAVRQQSSALVVAEMVLRQKGALGMRIAANGPTVGEVISRALSRTAAE